MALAATLCARGLDLTALGGWTSLVLSTMAFLVALAFDDGRCMVAS